MKQLFKYSLYIFLPWGIVFSGIFTLLYLSETERIHTHRLENERQHVQMGRKILFHDFQSILSDLLILAESREFHTRQQWLTAETVANVQGTFFRFAAMKGVYSQVRFLDIHGQEIVRVNHRQGETSVVAPQELQNKSGRYYFEESLKMARDMVYISPLDLNMENGKIEKPHNPVIRFGTPVYNEENEKIGILLLNYSAAHLLDRFFEVMEGIEDHAALLNKEGYCLKHSQGDLEWGFLLNPAYNIHREHPASAKKIFSQESGQFTDDDGIFTFSTIHPFHTLQEHDTESGEGKKYPSENKYRWKIVAHIPPDVNAAAHRSVLLSFVKIAAPVFVLLTLSSLGLARAKIINMQDQQLLKRQATIDSLTGLPNRQLFQDRLTRALLRSKRSESRFALFFIDLDRFKTVNDSLGHAAGDQLLKEASSRISQVVRESDTVARFGGDEFVVILHNIKCNKATGRIAQLILETIAEPFFLKGQEADIGASIGIATFPENGHDTTSLLMNADSAMYKAKDAGRNSYCFFNEGDNG